MKKSWIMDFIPFEIEAETFDEAIAISRSIVPKCCGGHVKNGIARFDIPRGLKKPAIPLADYAIEQLKAIQ